MKCNRSKQINPSYLKIPCCLLFILGFLSFCSAQTYHYSFKENKLEFLSSALLTTGVITYDKLRAHDPIDDLFDLSNKSVWKFDSGAISQNSESAGSLSDKFLYGSLMLPLTLGLSKNARDDNFGNILLMGTQGLFINTSVNSITKMMAGRHRPYVYRYGESFIDQPQSKNDSKSFYSGHTSTTAYLSFFTAKVYSDLHPDSKFKPVVWGLAATVPAVTGYLRYKAGKHFPTDIITGYVVGAGFGILVPQIYKNKNTTISPQGAGLSLRVKL